MDYNGKVLKDNSGKKHTIYGDCFASGGEGEIFKLSGENGYVAKIYYPKYRTDERHNKLKAMLLTDYNKLPECAWPVSVLYDDSGFCGFVMRSMTGYINLIDFYVYDNRSKYTWAQYVTVAMNIAAVVSSLHELGHVVGDLNPNNILVDTKSCKVAFVDTDSYHIKSKQGTLYPCVVATPDFSAPELQGVDFQKLEKNKSVFNTNTDNFSLAILIFRLLMNGVHPFACTSSTRSVSEFQPVHNIMNGCCAFFEDTNASGSLERTMQAPDISLLPESIQKMFRRALLDPGIRPCAEKWFYELLELRKAMCKCGANKHHEYYSELSQCPWCLFEKEYRCKMQIMRQKMKKRNAAKTNRSGDFTTYDYVVPKPVVTTTPSVTSQNITGYTDQNDMQSEGGCLGTAVAALLAAIAIALIICLIFSM